MLKAYTSDRLVLIETDPRTEGLLLADLSALLMQEGIVRDGAVLGKGIWISSPLKQCVVRPSSPGGPNAAFVTAKSTAAMRIAVAFALMRTGLRVGGLEFPLHLVALMTIPSSGQDGAASLLACKLCEVLSDPARRRALWGCSDTQRFFAELAGAAS